MRFKASVINGWDGRIEGTVLVTEMRISFLGDIDSETGDIIGEDLDIVGENIKGKIFVFPEGRGSTVGSNVLYGLAKSGLAPKLLATVVAEMITISGSIYGGIPMISNLPREAFNYLKKGDKAEACILDGVAYLEG